jgi:hypothetical protein
MGLIYFQPSQGSEPPEVLHYAPTSAATLTLGEPVARDGSDPEQVAAHAGGATVTGILGTAMGTVASGSMPHPGSKVMVAIANRKTLWLGQVYDISASAVATAAAATHEGVQYGMVEVGGSWYVDEEDVTHVVLRVVKVLPQINAVLFRWIGSAIEGA